jgi:hypothetical protein
MEADAAHGVDHEPARGRLPERSSRGLGPDRHLAIWVAICAIGFIGATMGTSPFGRTTQTVTDLINSL